MLIMILSTGCQKEDDAALTIPYIGPGSIVADVSTEILTTAEEYESSSIIEEQTTETETTEQETTVEVTTEEMTTSAEETTTVEPTTEEPTTEEPTVIQPTEPHYTFTELGKYMYVQAPVNVRTLPSTDGDVVTSFDVNHQVWVSGQCNETGWYRVEMEGQQFYISGSYLGDSQVVVSQSPASTTKPAQHSSAGFVYYTVAGQWPNRSYEEYLYNCLVDRNIAWWYPYAVAQIWQESRWNPESFNGVDAGIVQFNLETFPARAAHHANYPNANIWNAYDSLYVYSFYIRDVLVGCNYDVEAALSYYIKGHWNDRHQGYIDAVYKWYNALQAQ